MVAECISARTSNSCGQRLVPPKILIAIISEMDGEVRHVILPLLKTYLYTYMQNHAFTSFILVLLLSNAQYYIENHQYANVFSSNPLLLLVVFVSYFVL
jgi:hypothetical protein